MRARLLLVFAIIISCSFSLAAYAYFLGFTGPSARKEILKLIPIGTQLNSAKGIIESHEGSCSANESAWGKHETGPFYTCSITDSYGDSGNKFNFIVFTNDGRTVSDVQITTFEGWAKG